MKLPRMLVSAVLWGCSGPQPSNMDGGVTDAGQTDAGNPNGPCIVDTECDAGAGMPFGFCADETLEDGGTILFCEMAV